MTKVTKEIIHVCLCIFLIAGCQQKEKIVYKYLPAEPVGNSVISADNNPAGDEPKLPEPTALRWYNKPLTIGIILIIVFATLLFKR